MRRLRAPSRRAYLALGGGLLTALALPPWGFWPLALIGISMFEAALGACPERGIRFRLGWLFGAGWLFPGMIWMWFLSAPGYLLGAAMFATYHGVAAMIGPGGRWRVLGRPLAHTLAEALRFGFPFGGVPLASLAISQSSGPFVGVVRIGGPLLLTWLTFQIGFVLGVGGPGVARFASRLRPGSVAAVQNQPGPVSGGLGLVGLAAVGLVAGVAALAPSGNSSGRSVRVAIVQGGGPQGTHAVDFVRCNADGQPDAAGALGGSGCVTARQLAATRGLRAEDGIDIVVWPENVIDVAQFAGSSELAEVAAQARRLGAAFLVGVTEDAPNDRFTNAQVVVTADGEYTGRYDKVRRVPFGEYVPMRGLLEALGAPTDLVPRNAVAGTAPGYLDVPGDADRPRLRVAVVISWEVFFGGRARDGVGQGGELLINPTNGSSYTWTVLQTQQIASSRLRAIETGRWVAQAAPTGFSAFVSPGGDVIDRTSVGEQQVIVRELELRDGRTWYVALGDGPWTALFSALLALTLWRGGRRRARTQPADSSTTTR